MSDRHVFVDTSVLVYAHDTQAGDKHAIARERVSDLWNLRLSPSTSVQVLQELYVTFVRRGVPPAQTHETVRDYLQWDVIPNDTAILLNGLQLSRQSYVSLWDGLILAAAKRAKAAILWSEDLNTGQKYDGITVVNPLAR